MLTALPLALLLMAGNTGVAAQSLVYTTVDVYESCSDTNIGTDTITSTITSTITETTCPLCAGMTPTQNSNGNMGQLTHTTVYTTVFSTVCSTGMVPATYTVTESCTGATPTFNGGPGYVPQGYTTTVTVCTVCNMGESHNGGSPTPWTVTLTVPCESTAGTGATTSTNAVMGPGSGSGRPAPTNSVTGMVNEGSTLTETTCPGSSACGHIATKSMQVTNTMSSYSGAAAPLSTARAANILAAFAAAGVVLI